MIKRIIEGGEAFLGVRGGRVAVIGGRDVKKNEVVFQYEKIDSGSYQGRLADSPPNLLSHLVIKN